LADPDGFDCHVLADDDERHEMGSTVTFEAGMAVHLTIPHLTEERAGGAELRLIVYQTSEGSWAPIAEGEGPNLTAPLDEPGIYRCEVRITPRHLAPTMEFVANLAENEFPWIYGNAFRVMAP
jgi:hypothetical protein